MGYSLTAIVYGILGGAVILYMSFTSREVKVEEHEEKPQLWNSIKDLFVNRKFWIAGFANAFYSAAMSLVLASLPFFVKYTLQPGGQPIHHPVCLGAADRHRLRGGLGLAGAQVLADPGLAGGTDRPGDCLYPALLCQFAGDSHCRQRAGGFWLCRGDHHHGFDRRQDHG